MNSLRRCCYQSAAHCNKSRDLVVLLQNLRLRLHHNLGSPPSVIASGNACSKADEQLA